jgi:hypothetical protein
MNDLQTIVLRTLRIFGPLTNAQIAQRVFGDASPPDVAITYRTVRALFEAGLAVHVGQKWDISRLGRDVFARLPSRRVVFR